MVLTIKHRIRYYRRFRADIWGLKLLGYVKSDYKKYKRVINIFLKWHLERKERRKERLKRFVYRIDIINPRQRRKFVKKRFLTLRVVKLFYLTLKYKQFNKMAVASGKKDGSFENFFFLALEGRLLSFLYRTGFVSNMFESLYYVKSSFVALDRRVVNYYNQPTNIYTILSFHPRIKKKVYYNYFERVTFNKRSLFNPPKYIFVSYYFLFAFMIRYPYKRDFTKTTRHLDYYRATGFAV